MKIQAITINPDQQTYVTVGNWKHQKDDGILVFNNELGNEDYNFALFIHEIIEAYFCKRNNIDEQLVNSFDIGYGGSGEPGNHPNCPYREWHQYATKIERSIVKKLKIDWKEYNNHINESYRKTAKLINKSK